jgi:hypothetical protein
MVVKGSLAEIPLLIKGNVVLILVGAGVVWQGGGEACLAHSQGGSRSAMGSDGGDASVPAAPHCHSRPYCRLLP